MYVHRQDKEDGLSMVITKRFHKYNPSSLHKFIIGFEQFKKSFDGWKRRLSNPYQEHHDRFWFML
jgi:hypothetical protein